MQTTNRLSLKKSRNVKSQALMMPYSPRLGKTQHNFNQYLKGVDLDLLMTKIAPKNEKRRKKDRKLLVKYDKMYKKMKEKENNMFKTLSLRMNKVVSSERGRYIFLKENEPLDTLIKPNQKYFFNVKIANKNPPLRLFCKSFGDGNYTLYASRKVNKPYIEENVKAYRNPYKVLIKGHHDEGVFLTDSAYFTLIADSEIQMTLGYCFSHQVPAKELLPDYHLPAFDDDRLKTSRTILESLQQKFVPPEKFVLRRK